jgi:UDP-N-acetylmuramoyl-L-alanyl-D-glutamate--2,6-diaminopimelate ligase
MKKLIKKLLPSQLLNKALPLYHRSLALLAAIRYGFPSREIVVIGVTGTKGKTTTVELIERIFSNAGYKTAVSNSLRFKIGHRSIKNTTKTSMPGRFTIQKLLRSAVTENCDVFILEMTSEGAKQYRHTFINLDVFVFLNLAPEHIESHGSYENYLDAKVSLASALARSKKKRKVLILNRDQEESKAFLAHKKDVDEVYTFSIKDAEPYRVLSEGIVFRLENEDIRSSLPGEFSIKNAVAASAVARVFDIRTEIIRKALSEFKGLRGRVEKIESKEDFDIYVDNAHTPDSFEALFKSFPTKRIIAVFGSAGGGRDIWKRPALGKVADNYATEIILTTEDSYDEDPEKILAEIASGIRLVTPEIIVDRREAIRTALKHGRVNTAILILGKGSEPYQTIRGVTHDWDDARVVREELEKLHIERIRDQKQKTPRKKKEKVFKATVGAPKKEKNEPGRILQKRVKRHSNSRRNIKRFFFTKHWYLDNNICVFKEKLCHAFSFVSYYQSSKRFLSADFFYT